jgi:hypothetical protein
VECAICEAARHELATVDAEEFSSHATLTRRMGAKICAPHTSAASLARRLHFCFRLALAPFLAEENPHPTIHDR